MSTPTLASRTARNGAARGPWHILRRRPLALVAASFLVLVIFAAMIGPWLSPISPDQQDLAHVLAGPSPQHWLGTDRLGRDVLGRLMVGGGVTLLSALTAVSVFTVLGVALGLLAGYLGGLVDRVVARLGDLMLALPGIIILLMVLSVFSGNTFAAMIALGVMNCPHLLRVVRGVTLALRNELYVKAARLSGLHSARIMLRHILPRLPGPIIVQVSLFSAAAILAQSALSFLGLSAPETKGPTWGNMIAEASQAIDQHPWLLVPSGGTLALTVLALGLLGDALRDSVAERTTPATSTIPARRRQNRRDGRSAGASTDGSDGQLLSVRGLSVEFPSPEGMVTVVKDVSFAIGRAETIGIVGESGCGKSVTAKSILGLLPGGARISSGSITFDGHRLSDVTRHDLNAVRGSRIGFISQEPTSGLDPCFRVGSQLVEVIRHHDHLSRRAARARAVELLRMTNLANPAEVARKYPHELSGGMAQRVSIALALASSPDLLIADEPTTALDVTIQAEMLWLLRDLQRRFGMAIILITHDWGVLADLCDRAIVMYAGEIVEQANVAELYRTPMHPYTAGLLASDPSIATLGDDLPSLPGTVPAPNAWPAGCHFEPRCPYATDACRARPIPLDVTEPGRASRCIRHGQLATL